MGTGLCCAVCAEGGSRIEYVLGTDNDNIPAGSLSPEYGYRPFDNRICAFQIDGYYLIKFFRFQILQLSHMGNTCIGDHNVDPAQPAADFMKGRFNGVQIRDIHDHRLDSILTKGFGKYILHTI